MTLRTDFNPRSREGSDGIIVKTGVDRWHFNPRSREGSDYRADAFTTVPKISIHAPARGATVFRSVRKLPVRDFNPRSREGSDVG